VEIGALVVPSCVKDRSMKDSSMKDLETSFLLSAPLMTQLTVRSSSRQGW